MAKRPPSCAPLLPGRRAVVRPSVDVLRGSAAARGYDSDWRETRETVIRDQPICAFHGVSKVCTGLSETVDHIKPLSAGGARLDRDNLRGLCNECHFRVSGNFRATGNNDLPRRHRIENHGT